MTDLQGISDILSAGVSLKADLYNKQKDSSRSVSNKHPYRIFPKVLFDSLPEYRVELLLLSRLLVPHGCSLTRLSCHIAYVEFL